MNGRTWKHANREGLMLVRGLLLRRGGILDKEQTSPHELWRIRIERVVFTAYTSGTLYCSGGNLPEMVFLYESISKTLGIE